MAWNRREEARPPFIFDLEIAGKAYESSCSLVGRYSNGPCVNQVGRRNLWGWKAQHSTFNPNSPSISPLLQPDCPCLKIKISMSSSLCTTGRSSQFTPSDSPHCIAAPNCSQNAVGYLANLALPSSESVPVAHVLWPFNLFMVGNMSPIPTLCQAQLQQFSHRGACHPILYDYDQLFRPRSAWQILINSSWLQCLRWCMTKSRISSSSLQLPNLNPSLDTSRDIPRSYLKLNFPLQRHFNKAPTAR